MGADARLFVFDYELYRTIVVPAFLRILRDGSVDGWILNLYQAHMDELGLEGQVVSESTVWGSIDLLRHCVYLDEDFGVRDRMGLMGSLYDFGWEGRSCASEDCLGRTTCPFHPRGGHSIRAVTDFLDLLHLSVTKRCLGPGQFLGRSIDCFFYWDTLEQLGVSSDNPIRALLERLGRRGFVVGYNGMIGTDGIHGWLSPDETRALAEGLFALNLPQYEYSFSAMEGFKTLRNVLEGRGLNLDFQWPVYEHPGVPFEELSLSYVRTVCGLAARDGKGVLWGNDIG